MPTTVRRPLKWLAGIQEADVQTVQTRASSLLQEGPTVLEEVAHNGVVCLRLLLEKDAAPPVDQSIVALGARLIINTRAVSLLLQHGYIAPSILLMREMIHALVLGLFLRGHPEKADAWMKSNTAKERLQFAFGNIRRNVEHGEAWKGVYDYLSTMGHANVEARVAYGRSRRMFGYDYEVRGLYDPPQIAVLFVQTLELLLWFESYFYDWYRQELKMPSDFESNLKRLDAATKEFKRDLRTRAEGDDTAGVHKDSLSIVEQSEAVITLKTMMEEKWRGRELRP